MPYNLWSNSGSIFPISCENDSKAASLIQTIHQHGLNVEIDLNGDHRPADQSSAVSQLGGAETDANLRRLQQNLQSIRGFAQTLVRADFRTQIKEFLPQGNRSVESALRNLSFGTLQMLNFIKTFLGKEVKHPLKSLGLATNSADYGRDPEVTYLEAESGTFHTLQTLGSNQALCTYDTYVEDTPSVRRYLRYIDSLSSRVGIRVVYCPKEFNHLDELAAPVCPRLRVVNGTLVREVHSTRHKLLFVSMTFDFNMFSSLSIVETHVQPGQSRRQADSMDYTPIFVDNLKSILQVITTLGGFSSCKIYYKDYRNSARSSQVVPSS